METKQVGAQEAEAAVKRVWPDAHARRTNWTMLWYIHSEAYGPGSIGGGTESEGDAWIFVYLMCLPADARGESNLSPERKVGPIEELMALAKVSRDCIPGAHVDWQRYHEGMGDGYENAAKMLSDRAALQVLVAEPDYRTLYEREKALADELAKPLRGAFYTDTRMGWRSLAAPALAHYNAARKAERK